MERARELGGDGPNGGGALNMIFSTLAAAICARV